MQANSHYGTFQNYDLYLDYHEDISISKIVYLAKAQDLFCAMVEWKKSTNDPREHRSFLLIDELRRKHPQELINFFISQLTVVHDRNFHVVLNAPLNLEFSSLQGILKHEQDRGTFPSKPPTKQQPPQVSTNWLKKEVKCPDQQPIEGDIEVKKNKPQPLKVQYQAEQEQVRAEVPKKPKHRSPSKPKPTVSFKNKQLTKTYSLQKVEQSSHAAPSKVKKEHKSKSKKKTLANNLSNLSNPSSTGQISEEQPHRKTRRGTRTKAQPEPEDQKMIVQEESNKITPPSVKNKEDESDKPTKRPRRKATKVVKTETSYSDQQEMYKKPEPEPKPAKQEKKKNSKYSQDDGEKQPKQQQRSKYRKIQSVVDTKQLPSNKSLEGVAILPPSVFKKFIRDFQKLDVSSYLPQKFKQC